MQETFPRQHFTTKFQSIPYSVHNKYYQTLGIFYSRAIAKGDLLFMPIVVCITLKATISPFMKMRQLLPDRLVVETSTKRSPQASMLLLRDVVFTFRFGYTLCWWLGLHVLSRVFKGNIPWTKSLPVKPLESNDAMQVSSHLRRTKTHQKICHMFKNPTHGVGSSRIAT